MKEFMVAAFPMIVVGLALAVIAVMYAKARKQKNEKKFGQKIVIGAGLGFVVGAILNICGFLDSMAMCFSISPLCGMAIASALGERAENIFKNPKTPKLPNR